MRKLQKENYFADTRDICPRLSAADFGGINAEITKDKLQGRRALLGKSGLQHSSRQLSLIASQSKRLKSGQRKLEVLQESYQSYDNINIMPIDANTPAEDHFCPEDSGLQIDATQRRQKL